MISSPLSNSQHHPSLWIYEENYHLFQELQLWSRIDRLAPEASLDLVSASAAPIITLQLLERHKYMTLLCWRLPLLQAQNLPEVVQQVEFQLRCYHDAEVVEVIAYQGERRIPPRYLSNPLRGEQLDGKLRVNQLLQLCIHFALDHHYRPEPLTEAALERE
ncbi:MAG: DUF1249 domain-containing protein [Gammaproteobacteria bacterium]|nr:DUF1249 domain-containing protein [Gammaproteobacteria bacterium]